jgi:hypothetical protein
MTKTNTTESFFSSIFSQESVKQINTNDFNINNLNDDKEMIDFTSLKYNEYIVLFIHDESTASIKILNTYIKLSHELPYPLFGSFNIISNKSSPTILEYLKINSLPTILKYLNGQLKDIYNGSFDHQSLFDYIINIDKPKYNLLNQTLLSLTPPCTSDITSSINSQNNSNSISTPNSESSSNSISTPNSESSSNSISTPNSESLSNSIPTPTTVSTSTTVYETPIVKNKDFNNDTDINTDTNITTINIEKGSVDDTYEKYSKTFSKDLDEPITFKPLRT